MEKLLSGRLEANEERGGNMKKLNFYVCPECGNVITTMTEAGISCCGKKLQPLEAVKAAESDKIKLLLNGGLSPMKIVPLEGSAYTYLVLPVRLPKE